MSEALAKRLNEILPRVTCDAFLSGQGIGNEIAFFIFDYPAEHELQVREHVAMLMKRFASHHPKLDVLHLDLLDVVTAYMRGRGLLDKAMQLQKSKGDADLVKALKGPLAAEKIRDYIAEEHRPGGRDLLLISGVGSVWPMLRAHSLLNCMHTVMGQTPLVMFYPGTYDGTTLHLFGRADTVGEKTGTNPYYRAFRLIP